MTDYTRNDDRAVVIEKSGPGVMPFLIGLAVGAGVALLFAPQSGEATRRDIVRRGRRAKLRARELAEDFGDKAGDVYEDARDRVEEGIDTARAAVTRGKRKVDRAVDNGRAAAHQAREDLERRLAAAKSAYKAGVASDDGEA